MADLMKRLGNSSMAVTLCLPRTRPCSSGGTLMFMEDAAETVTAADVKSGEPVQVGDRFGQRGLWPGVAEALMRSVFVVEHSSRGTGTFLNAPLSSWSSESTAGTCTPKRTSATSNGCRRSPHGAAGDLSPCRQALARGQAIGEARHQHAEGRQQGRFG